MSIEFVASATLPTRWGQFTIHGFEEHGTGKEHVALTYGDIGGEAPVLCRIHSECLTGDCLFSLRCDCGPQLKRAMETIQSEGSGAIVYLRQEGRGIGLHAKIKAYALQDQGMDTFDANLALGHPADGRDYSIAAKILLENGIDKVRLMTNNPHKIEGLEKHGVKVVERIPHITGVGEENQHYLETKGRRMGHMI